MLHQVATLICYQWSKHACSSLWYTTWGAMWFVFCAVVVLATVIRTKMLVCSTHIAIVISICTERIQPQE